MGKASFEEGNNNRIQNGTNDLLHTRQNFSHSQQDSRQISHPYTSPNAQTQPSTPIQQFQKMPNSKSFDTQSLNLGKYSPHVLLRIQMWSYQAELKY